MDKISLKSRTQYLMGIKSNKQSIIFVEAGLFHDDFNNMKLAESFFSYVHLSDDLPVLLLTSAKNGRCFRDPRMRRGHETVHHQLKNFFWKKERVNGMMCWDWVFGLSQFQLLIK